MQMHVTHLTVADLVPHGDSHALRLGPYSDVAGDGRVVGRLLQTEVAQHVLSKHRAGIECGAEVVAVAAQGLRGRQTTEVGYLCHVIQVGTQVGHLGAHRDLKGGGRVLRAVTTTEWLNQSSSVWWDKRTNLLCSPTRSRTTCCGIRC